MLLWVGLGNPEPGMARNRHNIGFMALDTIAIRHGFSPWRQRFKGLVCDGTVGGETCKVHQNGEILIYQGLDARALDLHHNLLAGVEAGRVDLAYGGGANGHRVELGEQLLRWGAEFRGNLGDDDLEWLRGHRVLETRQLGDVVVREDV